MPADLRHPFFRGLRPTLHISHRGGAGLYPENTLLAFHAAVARHGTQMLEVDVQVTRDGVLVVAHDDTVDRCTDGSGDVRDFTLAELQRLDAGHRWSPDGVHHPFRGQGVTIPTLAEALTAFPTMRFNIELKRDLPDVEHLFAQTLRALGAVDRVCCGSAEDELGERVVKALPEGCHFFPQSALAAFILSVRAGEAPPEEERYAVLDMPYAFDGERLVDAALLSWAASRGKWVNVWTVDDEPTMRELRTLGVGGIMTDRPDRLRAVLDEDQGG
jgi:glycerophosphoryl diester phosphodiesterase